MLPRQEGGPAAQAAQCPSDVRLSAARFQWVGDDVRRAFSAVLFGVVLAGCSGGSTTPTASTNTPATSASAAATNPCASLKTTTPIEQVPAACGARWAPYHVTKVPPPNELELEHVPAAPKVVNKTNGAVSDADAQHWAEANNWDSGWVKWAHAYDQPALLPHLVSPVLIAANEEQALESGATIDDPDCALFPTTIALFPIGPDGGAYFQRKGLTISDQYVFVATASGPCASMAKYPDGHTETISQASGPVTAFVPGVLRHDPVLDDIWFTDGGGACDDPTGPPPGWCGR